MSSAITPGFIKSSICFNSGESGVVETEAIIQYHRDSIPIDLGTYSPSAWGQPKRTLAAIPCYNEAVTIGSIVLKARKYVDEVLVVDDGSSDDTAEITRAAGAVVVSHQKNQGYGAALRSCFQYAKDHNIDQMVILDGDGQHDPAMIPGFLASLNNENADIVIGSRFMEKNSNMPRYRVLGMKILDHATAMAGSTGVTDSQSGYRAYNRSAIERIRINRGDMSAGSEILTQMSEKGLKSAEIPITVRYDLENTSSQNPIVHGIDVLGNLVGVLCYKKPMLTFCLCGLIFAGVGLGTGVWAYLTYSTTLVFPYLQSMLSILLSITGLLLITSGLTINTLVQMIRTKEP